MSHEVSYAITCAMHVLRTVGTGKQTNLRSYVNLLTLHHLLCKGKGESVNRIPSNCLMLAFKSRKKAKSNSNQRQDFTLE